MANGQPDSGFNIVKALKKFVVSAFVVFTFVGYTIHDRLNSTDGTVAVVPTLPADTGLTTPLPADDPPGGDASQPSAIAVVPSPTFTALPATNAPSSTSTATSTHLTPMVPEIGITTVSNSVAHSSATPIVPSPTTTPQPATLVPSPRPAIAASPTAVVKSGYKDGQYTGDVADAFYGYVQVKAVIQAGRITDVQFLQYPQDRRTSARINSVAAPALRTEAIRAQKATVNIISGATLTSEAFVRSLQSALNKAKA